MEREGFSRAMEPEGLATMEREGFSRAMATFLPPPRGWFIAVLPASPTRSTSEPSASSSRCARSTDFSTSHPRRFMPDHFHALAAGAAERSHLGRFFDKFRQQSGYYHRQLAGQRLWQEGYFDRSLRKEEDTFEVVSYILANPVRAGLCKAAVDYPFSGSSRYSLSEIATFVQWRP
jgi:REP element-mobilizing transposase RayT